MSCLIGFLADVDFGSEKLRFLGGSRFDIYGAYQFITHKPIKARVSINGEHNDNQMPELKKYHFIGVINIPELSPGFLFDKPGLSLIPSSSYLLPFVLNPYSTERLPLAITIELEKETFISIDGEKYKATSVQGTRIDNSGLLVPW